MERWTTGEAAGVGRRRSVPAPEVRADIDTLAADTLLRGTIARILTHASHRPPRRPVRSAGSVLAERARSLLAEHLADPPSLEQLATTLGTGPFSLLRAFRTAHGLPPHAWLTDERVRRTRSLLDEGVPPGQVALAVGFSDQPHLTRHFTRIVGVPPGAYQRERRAGARTYKTGPETGA